MDKFTSFARMFLGDIIKIGFIVAGIYSVYLLYGLKKGFIMISA